jgi:hypothetical protein
MGPVHAAARAELALPIPGYWQDVQRHSKGRSRRPANCFDACCGRGSPPHRSGPRAPRMSCMAGTHPFRRFLNWMERFRGREVIFRGVDDEQQIGRSRCARSADRAARILVLRTSESWPTFGAMRQAYLRISAGKRCCSPSACLQMNGNGSLWRNIMACQRACSTGRAVPSSRAGA